MIHYLHREQFIPTSVECVWNFFADPRNLNDITPSDMNFEIVTGGDTTYAVPYSPLGEMVHAFWIQKGLAGIFDFRQQKIIELFGAA